MKTPKKTTTFAKIEGEIVEYDFCHSNKEVPSYKNFTYLGEGTIYSVNGVVQGEKVTYHFWKNKYQ